MARYNDGTQQSDSKSRRQQEDRRRMEFRRAIETLSDQRRLLQEISDYPELDAVTVWQVASASAQRSAQPAH
ncbi:PA3496 family putative envelope integrity protein [Pseudomonas sp. R5(2019)]|uniref:PA3496 family putative envelope integrity protein n=1 Tax=Pseudomonas sp. R5(2019) TaxID=2697566 RepID=UPI002113E6DF